jgi:putative Ca2+/H+ antiporter (TMEM165/GDT1 family)
VYASTFSHNSVLVFQWYPEKGSSWRAPKRGGRDARQRMALLPSSELPAAAGALFAPLPTEALLAAALTINASGPAPPAAPPLPPAVLDDFVGAFSHSFANVAVAEIFDKTWFATVFLGTTCGALVTFVGSYSALTVHVFLSAGMGVAIASIPNVCPAVFDFAAAGVMLLLALVYAYEAWHTPASENLCARAHGVKEELSEHVPS